MSLLKKHTAAELLELLRQHRDEALEDDEQLDALFGRAPYWFEERIAPRYGEFVVQWRDAQRREYMQLWEGALGVRLPIVRNRDHELEFPRERQTLRLVQRGGGHVRDIEVRTVQLSEGRTSTGWIEYSEAT